jgi:predicted SnoaL-like aldol condensation-catalyzing enzyme
LSSLKTKPIKGAGPADVFRTFMKIWETGDLSQVDELISVDYVGHVAAGDRTREGLRQRILEFRKLYPVMRFEVQDQISSEDRVASRMLATGQDVRGNPVALMGLNISRICDGKIEEEWNTWEALKAAPPLSKSGQAFAKSGVGERQRRD